MHVMFFVVMDSSIFFPMWIRPLSHDIFVYHVFYGSVHSFISGFVHGLVVDFIYHVHLGFVPCCILDLSTVFMLGIKRRLLRRSLCLTGSPGLILIIMLILDSYVSRGILAIMLFRDSSLV